MGLDSYLRKKPYIRTWKTGTSGIDDAVKATVVVDLTFKDGTKAQETHTVFDPGSGIEIVLPVCYWRKANAIHRWFVDNCADGVDDCKPVYVPYEKLVELRDICKQIMADHSKAKELLPTQSGFFFGSTDYDEWYYQDIEKTAAALTNIEDGVSYEYQASW